MAYFKIVPVLHAFSFVLSRGIAAAAVGIIVIGLLGFAEGVGEGPYCSGPGRSTRLKDGLRAAFRQRQSTSEHVRDLNFVLAVLYYDAISSVRSSIRASGDRQIEKQSFNLNLNLFTPIRLLKITCNFVSGVCASRRL